MKTKLLYSAVVAVVAAIPTQVLAQGDSGEALVLEEVIVTAQKREQSLQDVALTVNAFSGDTLNNNQVFNFEDIGKLTAGLEIAGDSGVETEITLRGVGKASTAQGDPTVAVFFDGVFQPSPGVVFGTMLDVERIEVLRGPQGTLYGKNSPTGAINIFTNKPNLDAVTGSVDATYSSWNTIETRAALSVPLVKDKLAMRIAGLYNESDGYIENTTHNTDATSSRRKGARLSFLWAPLDTLSFTLTGNYSDFSGGNVSLLVGDNIFDYKSEDDFLGESSDKNQAVNFQMDWDLNNHAITWVSGYQDYDRALSEDRDHTAEPNGNIVIDGSIRSQSHEFRFESTNNEVFQYMIGAFYGKEDAPGTTVLNDGVVDIVSESSSQSFSVFTNNTWSFSERWALTFGLRYSQDKKALQEVDTIAPLRRFGVFVTDESDTYSNTSGSVKLQYFQSDNKMYYLSFDTGYRPGGFNPFLTPDFVNGGFTTFDQETSQALELGAKTGWFDNRLQLNGALYYQQYEDVQVLRNAGSDVVGVYAFDANGVPFELEQPQQITATAPEGTSIGAELELIALLGRHWTWSGSLAYNQTEFKDFNNAPCKTSLSAGPGDVPGVDYDPDAVPGVDAPVCDLGDTRGNSPRWTTSNNLEYARPVGNGGLDIFARGLVRTVADRGGNVLEGYNVLDLSLGMRGVNGWSVTLWGKNVTAEEYLVREAGFDADDQLLANPGAPRSFGVTGRYTF